MKKAVTVFITLLFVLTFTAVFPRRRLYAKYTAEAKP